MWLVWTDDPTLTIRLRDDALLPSSAHLCGSWGELCHEARGSEVRAVLLIFAAGVLPSRALPEFQQRHPRLPVIVLGDGELVASCAFWRMFGGSPPAFLPANLVPLHRTALERVFALFPPGRPSAPDPVVDRQMPAPLRRIIAACLTWPAAQVRGGGRLTVKEVARRLNLSRRTLTHRLAQSGLPSPRTLLGWGHLLAIAAILEDSTESIDRVALRFGMSPAALRVLLRRQAGMSPRDLRQPARREALVRLIEERLAESTAGTADR